MYQYGNVSAQKNWARKFIEQCLQNVEDSRLSVIMPTADEWQAGLQRVEEMMNSGEDINARMEIVDNRRREKFSNVSGKIG